MGLCSSRTLPAGGPAFDKGGGTPAPPRTMTVARFAAEWCSPTLWSSSHITTGTGRGSATPVRNEHGKASGETAGAARIGGRAEGSRPGGSGKKAVDRSAATDLVGLLRLEKNGFSLHAATDVGGMLGIQESDLRALCMRGSHDPWLERRRHPAPPGAFHRVGVAGCGDGTRGRSVVARPGGMGAENGRHAFLDLDRPDIPDEPWNPGLGLPDSPRSTRESAATGRSTRELNIPPPPSASRG